VTSPFSSRTDWNLAPNPLARLLAARRAAGKPVVDLTASNPTECGIQYPAAAILEALSRPSSLRYEPNPCGLPLARAAVRQVYSEAGADLSLDQIVLTASSSEAYSFLFRLLAAPGEAVLAPVPSYPLFEMLARLNDIELRPFHLPPESGFAVDLHALELAARDPRVRAILLVSPGNPTGVYLSMQERSAILALAAQRGLAVICDEVFIDYAWAPRADRSGTLAGAGEALVCVLNGLSKMAGLPQLKLGWIAVSGPLELRQEALRRLEVIADTYLSVNTPVQQALPDLLGMRGAIQGRIVSRLRANRGWLERACAPPHPCACLPAEGGWYSIVQVPRSRTDEQWCLELLEHEGILAHPGYFFDFPSEGYLVLSLLPEERTFQDAAGRMLERIRRQA
jgi:alanine-synthesizing transaminase